MKCEQIQQSLTLYLLGDLSSDDQAVVKTHVDACPVCQAIVQDLRPTLDLLGDVLADASHAPERLSPQRLANIRDCVPAALEPREKWFFRGHPRLALAASLAFVLGLCCVMISQMKAFRKSPESLAAVRDESHNETMESGEISPMVDETAPNVWFSSLPHASAKADPTSSGSKGAPVSVTAVSGKMTNLTDFYYYYRDGDSDESKDEAEEPTLQEEEGVQEGFLAKRDGNVISKNPGGGELPSSGITADGIADRLQLGARTAGDTSEQTDLFSVKAGTDRTPAYWRLEKEKAAEVRPVTVDPVFDDTDNDGLAEGQLESRLAARPKDAKDGKHISRRSQTSAPKASGPAGLSLSTQDARERDMVQVDADEGGQAAGETDGERPVVRKVAPSRQSQYAATLRGDLIALQELPPAEKSLAVQEREPRALPKPRSTEESAPDELGVERAKETERRIIDEEEREGAEDKKLQEALFEDVGVNPFYGVTERAVSTFSIDVDTASYTLARNYLNRGVLPPRSAVRTEEFVNFFDYAYEAPRKKTFRVYTECAPSKFGRGLHLMKVGVKGRRLGREEQRAAVLTVLIDTSGSMEQPDRLGLVRKSVKMLVESLGAEDLVALVQYDSHARVVLEHTKAGDRKKILDAMAGLQCGGSTNLEEGMSRAYALAAGSFKGGAENRVLVLSDGVANLGSVAVEDILGKVAQHRSQGITCSVFGFGMGTYDDKMLEALADKGNGAYAFVDSEDEARRLLVDDLGATLHTIASDVKIQVEFSPKRVKRYRQLGYENRQLRREDFRNDMVDAGEVGSGQAVTALYEVELFDAEKETRADDLATVRVRYRRVDTGDVEEMSHAVAASSVGSRFDNMPSRYRLAAGVAEFSEILRGSTHAAGSELEHVAEVLRPVAMELNLDGRVQELSRLVESAKGMSRAVQ